MSAPAHKVSVAEVWRLALPPDTRLLGGESGLGRPVEWVSSLRAAFPLFGALREGYMALARLDLAPRIDPHATPEYLLNELSRAGASALVVDEPISDGDRALADRLGMPALLLPEGTDLHETERAILRTLVDHEGQIARYAMEARQHLQGVFDRAGTQGLLEELSRLTGGNRVVLRDSGGVAVAAAGTEAPSEATGTARQTFAVRAAGRYLGELVLLESSRTCTPVDAIHARQAAESCAVEMLQSWTRLETEERLGADLVEHIIDRTLDEQALIARFSRLGHDISPGRRHVVVAIGGRADSPCQAAQRTVAGDLQWVAQRDGASVLTTHYRGRTLVFLSAPATVPKGRERRWLQDGLARHAGCQGGLGVGRPLDDLRELHRAIEQAVEACDLGQRIAGRSSPYFYDELGLFRLLAGLRDRDELELFYEETLGELVRYDAENDTELVHTLEVFFEENANASQAARRLYVHRNTLTYRLQRIVDIAGICLDDSETRLALQLALTIHRLAPPS